MVELLSLLPTNLQQQSVPYTAIQHSEPQAPIQTTKAQCFDHLAIETK